MAGLAAVALIGVGTAGINKIKAKRRARRESIAEAASTQSDSRENRFASSKAREASEERRRRIEEDDAEAGSGSDGRHIGLGAPSTSGTSPSRLGIHPALRNPAAGHDEAEAPPPYIKDVPSYDEHFSHAVTRESTASTLSPVVEPPSAKRISAKPWGRRADSTEYRETGALIRNGQHINAYGNPVGTRVQSPSRPGETEEERKKRKRSEFFSLRNGNFWMLAGASLTR